MRILDNKEELVRVCAFTSIIWAITYAIVYKLCDIENADYFSHVRWAVYGVFGNENTYKSVLSFLKEDTVKVVCPLWYILVNILYRLTWMPLHYVAAIVSATINAIVYIIVVCICKKVFQIGKYAYLISFISLVVGPIFFPWFSGDIYIGQCSPNPWHNATNLMVKPFAILLFFFYCYSINNNKYKVQVKHYIVASILMILSVLAKPSFVQGFFPTIFVFEVLYLIFSYPKKKTDNLYALLSMVPAALIMGMQFMVAFLSKDAANSTGIAFGWLVVMKSKSSNVLLSQMLVLGFPIVYLILNRQVLKEKIIQVAVVYEIISWLEYAIVYEPEPRLGNANFGWANMLSMYILWLITICRFVKDWEEYDFSNKKCVVKNTILLLVLIAHIGCGLLYVGQMIFIPGKIS